MNVYLIGHRAVGKSTVAPLAAECLGRLWVDLDQEVERQTGQTISCLFADRGEDVFREAESRALQGVSGRNHLFVATGGGVVMREFNRSLLRRGFCVWLKASAGTILERLRRGAVRPRLTGLSLEEETERLLTVREPFYRSLADLVVEVDYASPEEVANRIAAVVPPPKG